MRWAGQYDRDRQPKKVVWEPTLSWKKQFYWLRWDNPVKGPIIQAEIQEENTVHVWSDKPCPGLKVSIDERILDIEKEVTIRINKRLAFNGMVEPRLHLLVRSAAESMDPARWFYAEVEVERAAE